MVSPNPNLILGKTVNMISPCLCFYLLNGDNSINFSPTSCEDLPHWPESFGT